MRISLRECKMTLRILVALATGTALLAQPRGLSGVSLMNVKGTDNLSLPLQIVVLLTLLTVLPAVIMAVTPFLRITVVLHFLRQALGTQSTPSNQVLVGLALFLTILVMQPVVADIYTQGWQPMERGELTSIDAFTKGSQPLKNFL